MEGGAGGLPSAVAASDDKACWQAWPEGRARCDVVLLLPQNLSARYIASLQSSSAERFDEHVKPQSQALSVFGVACEMVFPGPHSDG